MCAFALRRLDGRVKVYSWYAAALEFAVARSGDLLSCDDLCLEYSVLFHADVLCAMKAGLGWRTKNQLVFCRYVYGMVYHTIGMVTNCQLVMHSSAHRATPVDASNSNHNCALVLLSVTSFTWRKKMDSQSPLVTMYNFLPN